MGGDDIATLVRLGVNVVALCDVDDVAAGSYKALPSGNSVTVLQCVSG
jgi:hypothetical protein